MSRVLLVANSSSGSADRARLEQIASTLAALGEVARCEPPSLEEFDDSVRAGAAGADHVVIAGGDGTLNGAVNALEDRLADLSFGVVPMGTGNDLARTLGVPMDPVEAAETIVAGRRRRVDVGSVEAGGIRRLFLNACVGGFPVAVDEALDPDTKHRLGPLAFVVAGAKAAAALERSEVAVNGQAVPDCVAVGVGNGSSAGGGIRLWPSARIDDGLLDVCALGAPGYAAALKIAALVKGGRHEALAEVTTLRAPCIVVDSNPAIDINCDGELLGVRTPAAFTVAATLYVRL